MPHVTRNTDPAMGMAMIDTPVPDFTTESMLAVANDDATFLGVEDGIYDTVIRFTENGSVVVGYYFTDGSAPQFDYYTFTA